MIDTSVPRRCAEAARTGSSAGRAAGGRRESSLKTFLDFTRPPKPERRAVVLHTILRELQGLLRARAEKQTVQIRLVVPDRNLTVHVDGEQLRQVILNLVLNSLDVLPRGGTIVVEVQQAEGDVEIRVSDIGPRIAPDMLTRLFQKIMVAKSLPRMVPVVQRSESDCPQGCHCHPHDRTEKDPAMRSFFMSGLMLVSGIFCDAISSPAGAEDWRIITPDVIYGHKAGMALTYDVVRPRENANGAGVLFMVSGGWVSGWVPPENLVRPDRGSLNLFERIVDRGYTLILVRHGSSPYFKVPDAVSDVRLAIRHIRAHASDYRIDPHRIGVCGASAGGHLSLILGTMGDDGQSDAADPLARTSSRVQAVAAYFPPTDIREYVNSEKLSRQFPAIVFPDEQAAGVSPLLAVTNDDAPTLLIHGDKDELVPISHSERFREAMSKADVTCELIVMKGAAHGFPGDQGTQAETALLNWFDHYLAKTEAGK